MPAERGFTLLEVLVATAILAIAGVALLNASVQQLRASDRQEQRLLAHWVAMNRALEWRLAGQVPDSGRQQERVDMADQHWRVVSRSEATPLAGLRKLDVDVFPDAGELKLGGELKEAPPVASVSLYVQLGVNNAPRP